MKKTACIAVSLALALSVWAQDSDSPTAPDTSIALSSGSLTHEQVILAGAIPYASTCLSIALVPVLPAGYAEAIVTGATILGSAPHCVIDPAAGFGIAAVSTALYGAGVGLGRYPGLYGDDTFAETFRNAGFKTAMWSGYEGYAKARAMAAPGTYGDYRRFSFNELMQAPYQPKNLVRPSVWVPVLAYGAAVVGSAYASDGWDNAVWSTGKAYIGQREIPILMGLVSTLAVACVRYDFTAVGEEALFRGIGYEEIKCSAGIIPAKIADCVVFPAVHVPQEIVKNVDASTIATNYLFRSAASLALEWAYDEGGLEYSIASHMWIDVASDVLTYLCSAGASGNDLKLYLTVSVPL
jgi:membrane protease YdiL (CAAX protease family)